MENYKSITQISQCRGPKNKDKDISKYALPPKVVAFGKPKERKDIGMKG